MTRKVIFQKFCAIKNIKESGFI